MAETTTELKLDQPRDEQGRFASNGGGGASGADEFHGVTDANGANYMRGSLDASKMAFLAKTQKADHTLGDMTQNGTFASPNMFAAAQHAQQSLRSARAADVVLRLGDIKGAEDHANRALRAHANVVAIRAGAVPGTEADRDTSFAHQMSSAAASHATEILAATNLMKLGSSGNPDKANKAARAVFGHGKSLDDLEALDEESLIFDGAELKALGEGKIGGYLVVYGDPTTTDASPMRDYFTKETDFGQATTTRLYYHHGLDELLGLKMIGVGEGKLSRHDIGIWVEAQLNLADQWENKMYEMAKAKRLGWSSGTAPHLVRRERQPNGAHMIKSWPLGLDASITPTPAEPRARAIAIKALKAAASGEGVTNSKGASPTTNARGDEMPTVEIEAKLDTLAKNIEALGGLKATVDALALRLPAKDVGSVGGDGTKSTDVKVIDNSPPFKGLGEFLFAVRASREGKITNEQSNRLDAAQKMAIKASGASEQAGADAGFLVMPEFTTEIIKRAYEMGQILSRVNRRTAAGNSNSVTFLGVDETSRATGSRYGGVQAYWTSEGASLTASRPKFRRIEMKLNKITALSYATDELLSDASLYEQEVMEALPGEISFRVEDSLLNGNGVGQPLGILNSAALVTVAAEGAQTADTVNMANITKMWARLWARSQQNAVWFINQDVYPSLFQLNSAATSSATPVFLPPGGLSASPWSTLMGRPIIPIEYAGTIGDVGDITLLDLSQYRVLDKGGVQAASSMHVQFLTDEMVYRWTYRVDGQPLWHSALTPFKGSNTLSPFVALAAR